MLGIIPGASQKHCQEIIVIAGHHDHLGERQGEIYNGAVDNCTGVVTSLFHAVSFVTILQILSISFYILKPIDRSMMYFD